ncbi:MAG: serine--tRNA ligase [Candidatus Buchananbacteria bacterium RIFCSPHIGHO2_01_FULL_47_11b]|uniref:Serine--tRNA ligase n=1 Tax=Candidatus Buchananbacteria bacterium RIFCSPHIGHO2_01_FULL_47_11b TaxID=1797537 RepID=A0A1G1Y8J0_9BACT|nr:MAG: serine--tRNA ligase [Candidatus Buchananbacteria bacterium RIFCSPHIGHO2_01_FULL_47_11b]
MLDIEKIRTHTAAVTAALLKRLADKDFNLDEILQLDDQRRELIIQVDSLRAARNQASKIKPSSEVIVEMKKVGERIKKFSVELEQVEKILNEKLATLPNLPADDVVAGGKENNRVLRSRGEKPMFKFETQDHVSLATSLKIIDYERAVKMSGNGFWVYRDQGAILEWALLNYFIDFHRKNGYTFLLPPYLLTEQSAYTSGHLPKFRDDLYWTQDKLCLNATSEMMLGNYHRDEILDAQTLPLKYFAYSACFRREAGSYRAEERGMIRGHQFNKIEMFQFTKPEQSWQAFDELVSNAEKLVDGLGLHFQSVQLAAGDASAAMAKTIDIEVWIPSMGIYKEVSSVSNALDYQARRGSIRFKDATSSKTEFAHTLNASGLATSRLLPAILEQFQTKDGSVKIPKALQKFCGFKEIKKAR